MRQILFLSALILIFFACDNRQKLNSDEKRLAKQIVAEEKDKQEAEAASKQNNSAIADTLAPGFRFKEDRSVDPQNPPEIIDIAGNLDNKKMIKLSSIGKKITYIRLAPPPDSLFIYRTPQIRFTKTNIIATSHTSTCIYSHEGEFRDVIGKNEFDPPSNIPPPPMPKQDPVFAKHYNTPEHLRNARKVNLGIKNKGIVDIYNNNFSGEAVYFKYTDRHNKKSYLMKYDVTKDSRSLFLPGNNETNDRIISKGEKVALLKGKSTFRYHILDENTKIGYQRKWNSSRNGIMLLLQNIKGDTLCVFSEPDKITNYDASITRSTESGSNYFYNGQFTYRSALNDTVFRFVSPNKLLPVFLLNLGEHKVNAMQAIHPGYNLSNKFLLRDWLETEKNIFIIYTEKRSTINSRRKKTVNYYYTFYDKNLEETFHLPVDTLNYIYEIENDIDGGLPVWPKQTNHKGKIYKSFEGWELKRHVISKQFKQSTVLQEKKEKIIHLAESVGDAETIIMIIE